MKGYVIVDVTVNDPVEYEAYKKLTPAAIEAYDGRFLVRGGAAEVMEGDWQPGRIVVLEFPSVDRAKEWWSSDLYSKAKEIRQRAAATKMIIIGGAEFPGLTP